MRALPVRQDQRNKEREKRGKCQTVMRTIWLVDISEMKASFWRNENCIRPTQLISILCVCNLHLGIETISRFIWVSCGPVGGGEQFDIAYRMCMRYAISLFPYQFQKFIHPSLTLPPSLAPGQLFSHFGIRNLWNACFLCTKLWFIICCCFGTQ